jgi:hypothetical protein
MEELILRCWCIVGGVAIGLGICIVYDYIKIKNGGKNGL